MSCFGCCIWLKYLEIVWKLLLVVIVVFDLCFNCCKIGLGCLVVNVLVGRNNMGKLFVSVVLVVVIKFVEFGFVDVEYV